MIASSWDGGIFRILHGLDYVVENPGTVVFAIVLVLAAIVFAAASQP